MLAGIVSANSLHYLKRVCRHLNHPAFTQMWLGWTFSTACLVGLPSYQLTLTYCLFFLLSFASEITLGLVFRLPNSHMARLPFLKLISVVNLWVVPANHLHQSASLKRQRAESHNRWMKQEPRVLLECRLLSERKIYQRTTFFIITVLFFPLENVWHIF